MNESISPLTFLLILNSLLSIILILNQNESKKESATNQSESSVSNPLETGTWICLFLQFLLLILKVKGTDF